MRWPLGSGLPAPPLPRWRRFPRVLCPTLLTAALLTSCGLKDEIVPPPGSSVPQTPSAPSFAVIAGGEGWTWGQAVATAQTGRCALAGGYDGDGTLRAGGTGTGSLLVQGQSDVFVTSLAPDGTVAWTRTIAGHGYAYPSDVAIGPEGEVTLAGYFLGGLVASDDAGAQRLDTEREGGFLVRYLPDGRLAWALPILATGWAEAMSVEHTGDGAILACGMYEGALHFHDGAGGDVTLETPALDGWVACYEASGHLRWARSTQTLAGGYATAWSVDVGPEGEVVVAGDFCGTASFSGDEALGDAFTSHAASADAFVASLDREGQVRWVRIVGGPGSDMTTCVGVRADGSVLLGGTFQGTVEIEGDPAGSATLTTRGASDGFVVAWDREGVLRSVFQVGGEGPDAVYAVTDRPDGCAVVAGCIGDRAVLGAGGEVAATLDSAGTGDCEGFLACLAPDGELAWWTRLGGLGDDHAVALAAFPDDDVVVGGMYVGDASLGDPALPQVTLEDLQGLSQAVFLRLDPDGRYRP